MRVLIAHSEYRVPGGEDRYVRQQQELLGRGHQVHAEIRRNADLPDGPRTAVRMMVAPDDLRSMRRALRRFAPDVVHLHNPYPSFGPSVHLATERARIPLVQTIHNLRLRCPNGLQFTEGSICRRCEGGRYDHAVRHECFPSRSQAVGYAASLWVHRFAFGLDDKVRLFIAPSEFIRGRLLEWGFPSDRIALVRNFTVPPDHPAPVGMHGLFLGRLSTEKGVDTLLLSLAAMGDPPFDVAGSGPAERELRARAADLGLTRTRFLGMVSPKVVPEVIGRARYLVFPSRCAENAPLAALEAMAGGRPIIAAESGGLPELASGGRGRLFPAGDADALAAAMTGYEDAGAAQADGERALAFVRDECTPERHLVGLEAAYARATS